MNDYNYYKSNPNVYYDYDTDSEVTTAGICDHKAKEAILLKCIHCASYYKAAWKCEDTVCPLYQLKTKWMKRPHTCSKQFLEVRKNAVNKYIKEENNDEL